MKNNPDLLMLLSRPTNGRQCHRIQLLGYRPSSVPSDSSRRISRRCLMRAYFMILAFLCVYQYHNENSPKSGNLYLTCFFGEPAMKPGFSPSFLLIF